MAETKTRKDESFVHCPHCKMPVFNDIHMYSGAKIDALPPKGTSTDELAILNIGTLRGVIPIGLNSEGLLQLGETIQAYLRSKRN